MVGEEGRTCLVYFSSCVAKEDIFLHHINNKKTQIKGRGLLVNSTASAQIYKERGKSWFGWLEVKVDRDNEDRKRKEIF